MMTRAALDTPSVVAATMWGCIEHMQASSWAFAVARRASSSEGTTSRASFVRAGSERQCTAWFFAIRGSAESRWAMMPHVLQRMIAGKPVFA